MWFVAWIDIGIGEFWIIDAKRKPASMLPPHEERKMKIFLAFPPLALSIASMIFWAVFRFIKPSKKNIIFFHIENSNFF